jgi:hypothetical protein
MDKIVRCSSTLVNDLKKQLKDSSMSRSDFLSRLQELELEDVSKSDWKKFAETYSTKTKGSGFFSGSKVNLSQFMEELEEAICRDGAALDEPPRENQDSPKRRKSSTVKTTKEYVKIKTELRRVLMNSVRAFEEKGEDKDADGEDKEEDEEEADPDVLTFFQDLDKDNSGYIERKEFVKVHAICYSSVLSLSLSLACHLVYRTTFYAHAHTHTLTHNRLLRPSPKMSTRSHRKRISIT